jgi:DNA-binding NarL/FixJ family response regulator
MGEFRTPAADPVWYGPLPLLTRRERPVLELVAAGWSTRRIAEWLCVSEQCITYHIGNLLAKFQSPNRAGLVSRAFVLGYLSTEWPPRAGRSPQLVARS